MNKILLTIEEAAALTPFSPSTIRRALLATDPTAFPPPLRGKKDSKGRYLIQMKHLESWAESLPDA